MAIYPQALLDEFRANPDSPAFEHGDRVVSRAELLDLVGRFRAGLLAAGVAPGSGVAVATEVSPEGFAAQLAVQTLGCRLVAVPPGLTAAQLPHVLADIDVLIRDKANQHIDAARTLTVGPELLAEYAEPSAQARPDDICTVIFTSGSTGAPKGAAFSYAAYTAELAAMDVAELAHTHTRFLLFGTLASAVMARQLRRCLFAGGTAVIPDGLPDFPVVLERLRITAALMTVPRLHKVLDVLRTQEADLSSLRMLMVSGSPLSAHRLTEAFDQIGSAVHVLYGQTETGVISLLSAADVARCPDALASVGRPARRVEVQVRDESGRRVPDGEQGELWVRNPQLLKGYWGNAAETAEVLRSGWLRTRDLGHQDADGFLYLTGRSRDVIIINAIIHHAAAIERVLIKHPRVDQAYVVGAPDEQTGEAAHAFLIGDDPDIAELRAIVGAELGAAAIPATFTVVADVPLLPNGKPDKRRLLAADR